MSGPPRRPPKPPLPPPPHRAAKALRFDPSEPLLDLEDARTNALDAKQPGADPLLPSLALPSKRAKNDRLGLGPVAMSDPMQDATTLVSSPNAIAQVDEPISGGTEIASVPSGGTQVAATPIPTAAPTPSSIIPGGRNAQRSALPFVLLGVAAAMTWGAAVAAGVLQEPPTLPALATADPPPSKATSSVPAASSAKTEENDATPAASEDAAKGAPESPESPESPEPPPVATSWSIATSAPPKALRLVGKTAIASVEDTVVGFSDGAQSWSFEGAHEGIWTLGDGSVAVVLKKELVVLSAQDGSETHRVAVPSIGKDDPVIVAADADSQHVLVALADARFAQFTPAACADATEEEPGECVRVVGRLTGEYLEPTAKVGLGEDGTRYLAEDDALRAFDLDFRTVFEASTPADIRSMVRVPGGRLALQFAQEAALLDRDSCRGRSEVRIRTQDEQAPSGCVLWRYGWALDPVPPAAVDTSSLALNERGKLQVVAEGDEVWKIPLAAFGPVAASEAAIFTLATESGAIVVAEVDASNGTIEAKHPVPFTPGEGERSSAHLVFDGGTLAASIGTNIGVLTLPP